MDNTFFQLFPTFLQVAKLNADHERCDNSTNKVDEEDLFDFISRFQSKRMDDQVSWL